MSRIVGPQKIFQTIVFSIATLLLCHLGNAGQIKKDISITLEVERSQYLFGEDIQVRVLLVNNTGQDAMINPFGLAFGTLKFDVQDNVGKMYWYNTKPLWTPAQEILTDRDTLEKIYSLRDWYGEDYNGMEFVTRFPQGKYTLRANFIACDSPLLKVTSNEIGFEVVPAPLNEETPLSLLTDGKIAFWKFNDGFTECSRLLRELVENHPVSVYRLEALYYSARANMVHGDTTEARSFLTQAVAGYPNSFLSESTLYELTKGMSGDSTLALYRKLEREYPGTAVARISVHRIKTIQDKGLGK